MSKEIYFSIDVETDGPIPGPNSLLSLGAVALDNQGNELGTFYRNFKTLPPKQKVMVGLFGLAFAGGMGGMLLFQLLVNVGMVLGIMPITGIPLPFITHGGASLISLAVGLGILQSINIHQRRAEW